MNDFDESSLNEFLEMSSWEINPQLYSRKKGLALRITNHYLRFSDPKLKGSDYFINMDFEEYFNKAWKLNKGLKGRGVMYSPFHHGESL